MQITCFAALCVAGAAVAAGNGEWGLVPLGEPGNIKLPTALKEKAVFRAKTPSEPGLKLFGDGVKCVIVAPKADKYLHSLADEFAWHLSKMTGEKFAIVEDEPADAVRVVFGQLEKAEGETTVVKAEGRRLLISGAGSGASHGLTHVLEALGCRYLWPGESGKVIPRKTELVLPKDIDLDFTPVIVRRGVRDFCGQIINRNGRALIRLRVDPKAFAALQRRSFVDREGNRGFWQWHGVNDMRPVPGGKPMGYEWGHSFGDYYQRYGKEHPEWFALQHDGTREMTRPGWEPERPCLCLSNAALAEETISNVVAQLRKRPSLAAASACLPDGGHASYCLCADCRRLDAPNAPKCSYVYFEDGRHQLEYVSVTDRVLTFMNRVAAGVDAAMPGKGITLYSYNEYSAPPMRVRPYPTIVFFNTSGNYSLLRTRGDSQRNMAAWAAFGNPLFWRPNALRCFNVAMPQDISRCVFDDLEAFKANHLIGTDMDCMDNQWATKGLAYYMTARAFLNPARLSYDDHFDDYCRTGFGAAAEDVKAYFRLLTSETDRVAGADGRTVILEDGREVGAGQDAYVRTFDIEGADAILTRAEKAAAGEDEVLRRLRFLRWGLDAGRHTQRCRRAIDAKDPKLAEYQQAFADFDRRVCADPDGIIAATPDFDLFYNYALMGPALIDMPRE